MRRYYEHIREHDLTLTHALINLQRSRTVSGVLNLEEGTALHVVRETDAGVVVRGARVLATLAPISDEIAVYSPRLAQMGEPHSPFALNFAIPCGTPGLKFLCRESFDLGRSRFDHPLGSRFEEMDCVAFFDDVLVPWERVFLLGDVDLINGAGHTTGSSMHSAHQGAAKNLAKCEFVLGVALHMTQTLGNAHLPHYRGAAGRADDVHGADAGLPAGLRGRRGPRSVGHHAPGALPVEITRNLFTTAYPRMIEILQLLGSSSFMITPTEADFGSPLAPAIEQYLATEGATRPRPRQALPPGLGHRRQRLRQPPGPLRALLRQRPADARALPRRHLSEAGGHAARDGLPGPRRRPLVADLTRPARRRGRPALP